MEVVESSSLDTLKGKLDLYLIGIVKNSVSAFVWVAGPGDLWGPFQPYDSMILGPSFFGPSILKTPYGPQLWQPLIILWIYFSIMSFASSVNFSHI